MPPTLLSTCINKLTQHGIVELTGAWGYRWKKIQLDENDLNAGLLMWDMRRGTQMPVMNENDT